MSFKRCFKCKTRKSINDFYRHSGMTDGRLGKCKACTIIDSEKRIAIKKHDPNWVEYERARCRAKADKYRKPYRNSAYSKKWDQSHRIEKRAQCQAQRAVKRGSIKIKHRCERCGNKCKLQKHHPNYSKPLEVVWLCSGCHGITRRKPFGSPCE